MYLAFGSTVPNDLTSRASLEIPRRQTAIAPRIRDWLVWDPHVRVFSYNYLPCKITHQKKIIKKKKTFNHGRSRHDRSHRREFFHSFVSFCGDLVSLSLTINAFRFSILRTRTRTSKESVERTVKRHLDGSLWWWRGNGLSLGEWKQWDLDRSELSAELPWRALPLQSTD